MTVAEIIKVARMGRGWTIRELSRKARVPYVTVAGIENGARLSPGIFICKKLADAFGSGLAIFDVLTVPESGVEEAEETEREPANKE